MLIVTEPAVHFTGDLIKGVVILQSQDVALHASDFPTDKWFVISEEKDLSQHQPPYYVDSRCSVPDTFVDSPRQPLNALQRIVLARSQGVRLPDRTFVLHLGQGVVPPECWHLPHPHRVPKVLLPCLLRSVSSVVIGSGVVGEKAWVAAALCCGSQVLFQDQRLRPDWVGIDGVVMGKDRSLPRRDQTWHFRASYSLTEWDEALMVLDEETMADASPNWKNLFWRFLGRDEEAFWAVDGSSFVRSAEQRQRVLAFATKEVLPASDTIDPHSPVLDAIDGSHATGST